MPKSYVILRTEDDIISSDEHFDTPYLFFTNERQAAQIIQLEYPDATIENVKIDYKMDEIHYTYDGVPNYNNIKRILCVREL